MHRQSLVKVARQDVPGNSRLGGDVRVLLSPNTVGATDGFMGTIALEPGDYVAEQYNPYSDKFCYVVKGSVTMWVDGVDIHVETDEALMVRRGQRHRFENDTDAQAFLVFQICPLAPRPELGHVDTEQPPNADDPPPAVGGPAA
ncbi:cupin domain-containing protein [Flindersiella endophytica]